MSEVIREYSAGVRRLGEIEIYMCIYIHDFKLAPVLVVPDTRPLYLQSPLVH